MHMHLPDQLIGALPGGAQMSGQDNLPNQPIPIGNQIKDGGFCHDFECSLFLGLDPIIPQL
jgi:hypothetical protein